MEDILAITLVVGIIALFVAATRVFYKRHQQRVIEEGERRMRAEKYWQEQRELRQKATYEEKVKPTKVAPKKTISESYTEVQKKPTTQTSSTVPSSSSDDGFLTGMLVGAAIDSLLHSGKSEATEERSVGVSKSESSWGFDDSDSRKSVSSSMDTSSSWSSSDYSSSSSDSGPSSDW